MGALASLAPEGFRLMHIAEGILSPPVLAGGALAATVGVGIGLRRLRDEDIPRAAVLTAGFFVASLIHIPTGAGSVHLVLNGLMGLMLGWAAFPAIVVALTLQALIFQVGGLTVLGINTLIMAVPAVLVGRTVRPLLASGRSARTVLAGSAMAGGGAVALGAILGAAAVALGGREFHAAAGALLLLHVPVMLTEAMVTGCIGAFLHRVRPELLVPPQAAEPVP